MVKKKNRQKQSLRKVKKQKKRQTHLKKLSLSKQLTHQPNIEDRVDSALEIVEKGNRHKAVKILTELKKKHGDHPHICYGLGVLAAFENNYDEAASCFKKALQRSPDFVEAQFNLAATYQKQLNIFEMITAYRQVIRIGEAGSHVVQQAQDIINGMERQIRDSDGISLDAFLEAHQIFDRGVEHMASKEWKAAIANFIKALGINPNHPQSHGNLGLCYSRIGKRQLALKALDKALELDPHYQPARENRKLITSLKEGECPENEIVIVNCYKDRFKKKKSGIKKLVKALGLGR